MDKKIDCASNLIPPGGERPHRVFENPLWHRGHPGGFRQALNILRHQAHGGLSGTGDQHLFAVKRSLNQLE
ncbi:MAG: hypothetical protein Q8J72_02275 [Rhodocyclaceae bacterium]|nr:hypothetical protein [Rhodocyclaceae bacterium]